MAKYNVGDRVLVRSDLVRGNDYGLDAFIGEMADFKGSVVTIKQILNSSNEGKYKIEEMDFNWTDEMFECKVEDTKNYNKQNKGDVKMSKSKTGNIVDLWVLKKERSDNKRNRCKETKVIR